MTDKTDWSRCTDADDAQEIMRRIALAEGESTMAEIVQQGDGEDEERLGIRWVVIIALLCVLFGTAIGTVSSDSGTEMLFGGCRHSDTFNFDTGVLERWVCDDGSLLMRFREGEAADDLPVPVQEERDLPSPPIAPKAP